MNPLQPSSGRDGAGPGGVERRGLPGHAGNTGPLQQAMQALRGLPMTLLLVALLLLIGLATLGWNLLAGLLYPLLPEAPARALGRAAISMIFRQSWALGSVLGVLRFDASVLDSLRDEPGLIIVANHPSMVDAMILVARLPRSACIMKASLLRNVFLGTGARLARYVSNRSPLAMVRLAVADLQQGGQLVMFPEGTRTTQAPLNPFGNSVTLIAKRAGAAIQTVFIDTDSPYLGKGWPLWRRPPLPMVVTLRLGERFAPQADANALLRQIEAYFVANLQAQRPPAGP